jgi:uncharacterized protein (TIGR03437 family)
VVTTQPGIFTLNASGTGPAAALNQNGSVNSPNNPANKNEYVVLYLTGEGQTSPLGVTGKVNCPSGQPCSISQLPVPLLPVAVRINNTPASFAFAGEAPGFVSGVLQINVLIPPGLAGSGDLSVDVTIGGNTSQSGVTVSVK